MADLSTKFLSLNLKNPLVVSSSPLCAESAYLRQVEDAGAAAIVLHSLFEEQILNESKELDKQLWNTSDVSAESLSYYPDFKTYNIGPSQYVEYVSKAKQAVKIPIIASLNGYSNGGWIKYAQEIEKAGADALELNTYFVPSDVTKTGAEIEKMYLDLVRAVTASVKIPVAVKISPFFSSVGNIALELSKAGARGIVMFNRFYQPDIDLEELEVKPKLTFSRSDELRLRLHWTAALVDKVKADIAITGGVHKAEDVIKSMMVGAKVAMMTSALLQQGPRHLKEVETDLQSWLEKHEYESIAQMQGSLSRSKVTHPAAFDRANYMKELKSYRS
ncbi:MAG TPA: dihydroorotate dehydrogenase-like protein [Bdellovibrionales bacterium]|nr:MAG: dihydroorotate dehydrogenase [Bdellovibrionales bacterium GWB1_52_6]OFZ04857.1 MAG: dihydroorotate dehydrogenase [Bdellovibrionales bacterium GWA1_52_35]OFZ38332.1 MAG: dihydroorotate dehydrogenase [Bdellovibrionales bacterium GWC1_52_8]HAR44400.1 dihydroorotate dehydrogenase-like protein [Bdellovibrionales bacterium]HCM38943.1 dihydroorotate dehydrogenase-like protein [Bdellovibrionales bacterium]